jgi:hypothetical protein
VNETEKLEFVGRDNNGNQKILAEDADETAQVIAKTLRVSNSLVNPAENIEVNISSHSPDVLKEWSKVAHMYVVCDNKKIVGCG